MLTIGGVPHACHDVGTTAVIGSHSKTPSGAEEARALRWDHVVSWVDDADGWQPVTTAGFDAASAGDVRFAIYVWRSERYGGDAKTDKSRRTLALPQRCVEALRQHRTLQARDRLRAGELWQDHGLVFASTVGTPLDRE